MGSTYSSLPFPSLLSSLPTLHFPIYLSIITSPFIPQSLYPTLLPHSSVKRGSGGITPENFLNLAMLSFSTI
jgi:hypothetical protein